MERSPRILVIEDDEYIARLVQLHLERAGYRTSLASDGGTGLAKFLSGGADLVLLDVKLPVLDGWEVCRRLRAASTLPVVMLTACVQEEDRQQALGLGVDDFVFKPFRGSDLVARIAAVLQRRGIATSRSELV